MTSPRRKPLAAAPYDQIRIICVPWNAPMTWLHAGNIRRSVCTGLKTGSRCVIDFSPSLARTAVMLAPGVALAVGLAAQIRCPAAFAGMGRARRSRARVLSLPGSFRPVSQRARAAGGERTHDAADDAGQGLDRLSPGRHVQDHRVLRLSRGPGGASGRRRGRCWIRAAGGDGRSGPGDLAFLAGRM